MLESAENRNTSRLQDDSKRPCARTEDHRVRRLPRLQPSVDGENRSRQNEMSSALIKQESKTNNMFGEKTGDRDGGQKPGGRVCGNPAAPWVKQRRRPLPSLRIHLRPNRLNVPSNTLLPPNNLQQNAPSTAITTSHPLPVLPRHHTHQVPRNVPSKMERAES